MHSRITGRGDKDDAGRPEAFELENISNGVLMERLEKIERRIFENKYITERFRSLAKDSSLVNAKQYADISAAMQAQTKGLDYIEVLQRGVGS